MILSSSLHQIKSNREVVVEETISDEMASIDTEYTRWGMDLCLHFLLSNTSQMDQDKSGSLSVNIGI